MHCWPTEAFFSQLTHIAIPVAGPPYFVNMSRSECHNATRTLLLDVLEQCARHMDAVPARRAQFKPVAYAVHAALEDFERQFVQPAEIDHDRRLFSRAQDMALEWIYSMQELRREATLRDQLEVLPRWDHAGQHSAPMPSPSAD